MSTDVPPAAFRCSTNRAVWRRNDHRDEVSPSPPLCNCIVRVTIGEVNGVPVWHATKRTFGGI
jgi:hypothetical protein